MPALAVVAAVAACADFVDPNIPEAGGPAVLSAVAVVSDRGTVDVRGIMNAGLDLIGVQRDVPDAGLGVNDTVIQPVAVERDGDHRYQSMWAFDVASEPIAIELRGPPIPGIIAAPPTAMLRGIRREGPDTLRITAGSDLLIRLAAEPGASTPSPISQQWFLTIAAAAREFRLGGSGAPPDTILVPGRFLPAGDSLEVRLIYQQLAEAQAPPGDYIGVFTLDARLFWTVRVDGGDGP